ncbi:hypothetical protein HX99_06120 [Peptococcaceae bacterium SCADC1_2_3]|nr:hypothetical protein DK28_0214710 [Peptococcaceae bacterium SCADC1_2_3]KFI35351.1 hypothetical protein HX99_06120 [Peptococcaceae bacterium SCADC1_2_3]
MKLRICRDQATKTGIFGGHKGMRFSLSCRVEISSEEQELVEKYKVQDHVLTWREIDRGRIPGVTIRNLVDGIKQEVDDVATLLNNEEVIKGSVKDFKNLLMVMATFGGEEVIEI